MSIIVTAQQRIRIGDPTHVQGDAPEGSHSAVFEDDGDTGYFYALDFSADDEPVRDGMHIYNVAGVGDRHIPSDVVIGWSADGTRAVLLINDCPHAVFDFSAKRGFCRTGFPVPEKESEWSGHAWSDEALELFAADA